MDGLLQEEEEDLLQDYQLDHAARQEHLQQAGQAEEEGDDTVRNGDGSVEAFCKPGPQSLHVHLPLHPRSPRPREPLREHQVERHQHFHLVYFRKWGSPDDGRGLPPRADQVDLPKISQLLHFDWAGWSKITTKGKSMS